MSAESLSGAVKSYSLQVSDGSSDENGKEKGTADFHGRTAKPVGLIHLSEMDLSDGESVSRPTDNTYSKEPRKVEAFDESTKGLDEIAPSHLVTASEHESLYPTDKEKTIEPLMLGAEGGVSAQSEAKVSEEGAADSDRLDDEPELKRLLESLKLKGDESSFFILLGAMKLSMDLGLSRLEKEGVFHAYDGPPLVSEKLDDTDYSVPHRKEACIKTTCNIVKKALNFWLSIGSLFAKHGLSKTIDKLKDAQQKVDKALIVTASDESTQAATMAFKATPLEKLKCAAVKFFRMAEESPYSVIEEQKRKLEAFNTAFEKFRHRSLALDPLLIMHPGIRVHLQTAAVILKKCHFSYDDTLQMKLGCDLILEVKVPSFDDEGKSVTACLSVHDIEFSCNGWLAEIITRFIEIGGNLDFIPFFAGSIFNQIKKLGLDTDEGNECLYQIKIGELELMVAGVDKSHDARLSLQKFKLDIEQKYGRADQDTMVFQGSSEKITINALGDLQEFVCDLCNQTAFITREVFSYLMVDEKKSETDIAFLKDSLNFTTSMCSRLGHQAQLHLSKAIAGTIEKAGFRTEMTDAPLKANRRFDSTVECSGLDLVMMDDSSSKADVKIKVSSFTQEAHEFLHDGTPILSEQTTTPDGENIWNTVEERDIKFEMKGVECVFTAKKASELLEFSKAMSEVQNKELYNRFVYHEFKKEDQDKMHECNEDSRQLLGYVSDKLKAESDGTSFSLKMDSVRFDESNGYFKENVKYLYSRQHLKADAVSLDKSVADKSCTVFSAETANAEWTTKPDTFGTEIVLLKPVRLGAANAQFAWGDDKHAKLSFLLKEKGIGYMTEIDHEGIEHNSLIRAKLEDARQVMFPGSVTVLSRVWQIDPP
ncbi:hypothetical protein [Kistimonas asteriae]|uniref:hypothetical protein n=1 Tax=Kistimonas asteriae TaxID=517724 RepID=UPI001BA49DDE|nr:hypothetical protein [Kistimonas asteriae]